MRTVGRRLVATAGRPTLLAQGVSAVGALATMTALTRALTSASFGVYAAVFATYAFGNALVATTIGTRVMEATSRGASRIDLVARRDLLPVALCVVAAGGTAASVGATGMQAGWAAAGMLGFILAEVASSYILGGRRYWLFLGLVSGRTFVWVVATVGLMVLLPGEGRLSGALAASFVGTLVPVAYVVLRGKFGFSRTPAARSAAMVSGVGIANLALWLLASADRVILAHFALSTVATYAALYGLLDRVFRGIANADVQLKLPQAFAGDAAETGDVGGASPARIAALTLLGVVLALLGPLVVAAASGGKYHPPLAMSLALTGGMVAMLAAVPKFVQLIAADRAASAAKVAILAAVVNIVGNLLLAPRFGTASAAALTLLGYLIWLAGTSFLTRRGRISSAPGALAPGNKELSEELLEAQL